MNAMAEKNDDRLNVRMPAEQIAELETIHRRHGVPPAEFVRKLTDAALAFYRQNGFFSFPVRIEPEEGYLQRAIEYGRIREVSAAEFQAQQEAAKAKPKKPKSA